MARHNVLGKNGEDEACRFLEEKGYQILHRNWRSGHKELDIVAVFQGKLIVIEVKTRRNEEFGMPEEAVSYRKIRHLVSSADAYVRMFKMDMDVQFDIITVVGTEPPFQITHIEDAFMPPIW